jgi:hypothetical protein
MNRASFLRVQRQGTFPPSLFAARPNAWNRLTRQAFPVRGEKAFLLIRWVELSEFDLTVQMNIGAGRADHQLDGSGLVGELLPGIVPVS